MLRSQTALEWLASTSIVKRLRRWVVFYDKVCARGVIDLSMHSV